MIKKMLTFALSICMIFAISACGSSEEDVDLNTDGILESIREVYGEQYLCDTAIPEDILTGVFKINMDDVEQISTEMPVIGFHPDKVVIVKAKEGKVDLIEQGFMEAQTYYKNEAAMYPANIAKVNASQIIKQGDYIMFLLVGAPDDGTLTEEDALVFAKDETQKAVDAVNALF